MKTLLCAVKAKIMRRLFPVVVPGDRDRLLAATIGQSASPEISGQPPEGPFGLSMIRTADQAPPIDLFSATETCGVATGN